MTVPALPRALRRELERTVRAARRAAEGRAAKTLESLAVGAPRGWESMTAEQRAPQPAAHARRIGEQDTARLARECAYEHWRRMLFACFLAEAGLLIGPRSGMDVTLAEVRELAGARGGDRLAPASVFTGRLLLPAFRESVRVGE